MGLEFEEMGGGDGVFVPSDQDVGDDCDEGDDDGGDGDVVGGDRKRVLMRKGWWMVGACQGHLQPLGGHHR